MSNALVARQRFAESRVDLERQVTALQESVRLSTLRYTGGLASYYEVLEAQQQLFPAENSLARTRLNQLVAAVQLYSALGGGWRAEEERQPEQYPRDWTRSCRVADGWSEADASHKLIGSPHLRPRRQKMEDRKPKPGNSELANAAVVILSSIGRFPVPYLLFPVFHFVDSLAS